MSVIFCFNFSNCKNLNNQSVHSSMEGKCNVEYLVSLEERLNDLAYEDISVFMKRFKEECNDNIEYSQYSNELLFRILHRYPAFVIEALEEIDLGTKEIIFSKLSESVLDHDYDDIIKAVNRADGNESIKKQIISSILNNIQ